MYCHQWLIQELDNNLVSSSSSSTVPTFPPMLLQPVARALPFLVLTTNNLFIVRHADGSSPFSHQKHPKPEPSTTRVKKQKQQPLHSTTFLNWSVRRYWSQIAVRFKRRFTWLLSYNVYPGCFKLGHDSDNPSSSTSLKQYVMFSVEHFVRLWCLFFGIWPTIARPTVWEPLV